MHGGGCVLPRRRHSIFYKTRIQGRNQLRFNYYHHVRACLLIELVGFLGFFVENSKLQFLLKIASIHFMHRMEFPSSETQIRRQMSLGTYL